MGRTPCCDKSTVKKGPWSPEEDAKLKDYMGRNGTVGNWIALPPKAGLNRCGKSCRLRWLNYLRPNIKHGDFTQGEDQLICNLFASMGSRWSVIAAHLPGRTDNDIKNYWNTKLKKRFLSMAASPPPPPPPYHGHPSVFSSSSSDPPPPPSSSSSPLSSSSSSSLSQNTITTCLTSISPFTSIKPVNNIPQNHHWPSFLSRKPNSHLDIEEQGSLVNSGEVCLEVNQSNGLLWSGSGTVTTGDLDQSLVMDYGSLEEIKKLICSTSTGSSCNNLLYGENKTEEEKFMLYY